MTKFEKPAYNEEWRTLEFRRPDGQGQLNSMETVTSASILLIEKKTEADVTSAMVSGVAPYNSTQVRYQLKGGTPATVYLMQVRVTTSNGQKLEEKLELKVI